MLTNGANFTIEHMCKGETDCIILPSKQTNNNTCTTSCTGEPPGNISDSHVYIPVGDDYHLVLRHNPNTRKQKPLSVPTKSHPHTKNAAKWSGHQNSTGTISSCIIQPTKIPEKLITDMECEDRKKFAILTSDQFQRCLYLNTKDILSIGGQDIYCVGCRTGVEALLDNFKQSSLSNLERFESIGCSKFKMLLNYCDLTSDVMFYHIGIAKARVKEIIDSLPKKKHRCVYHSSGYDLASNRESPIQWNVLWENTTPECRKEILRISESELKQSQEMYIKKHKFCDDCQYHLSNAFRLLFERENGNKLEDFNAETYQYLSIESCTTSGERFVCVSPETGVLAEMMERLKNQLNTSNPNEERHARTLDVAQKEAVLCIAMFLYKRVQTVVMKFSGFVACVELLPHMIWSTFRTQLERVVEDIEGQMQIERTLKELAQLDAKQAAQKERKREKKRNRKIKLKQLYEQNSDVTNEDCAVEGCQNCESENSLLKEQQEKHQLKKRRDSLSPPGSQNLSDGGYSTSESGNSPRYDDNRTLVGNFNRRKGDKINTSSSGISCSSSPESSNSPNSTNSSSPTRVNLTKCRGKSEKNMKQKLCRNDSLESMCKKSTEIFKSSPETSKHCMQVTLCSITDSANMAKSMQNLSAKTVKELSIIVNDNQKDNRCSDSETKDKKISRKTEKVISLLEYDSKLTSISNKSIETLSKDKKKNAKNKNKPTKKDSKDDEQQIPQNEIDEFKLKHTDYMKQRQNIREKIRAEFECKLKTNGLVL